MKKFSHFERATAVDPDRNRQALDSRGGFDFYIYKRNAVLLYFILQEKAIIKKLCGAMLKLLIKPYEPHDRFSLRCGELFRDDAG